MLKILSTILLSGLYLVWNHDFVSRSQAPAAQSPNIIVILTDDQGYADVGFHGSKDIRTPNIDRIARNGAVCSEGYVSFAVCGPSRAGLLTGRYQDRFGFSRNPLVAPNDPTMGLPTSEQTMAELLKKANYSTAVVGKWHLGAHPSLHPNKRGFDQFFGFLGGGHQYFPENLTLKDLSEVKSEYDSYRTRLMYNTKRVEEKEYLTDALSREAVRFIREQQNKPFFLYLAYNAPHAPLQASEKYLSRFADIADPRRRTYAAMISAVDDGVGNILNGLEELKLDKNTIVFFLSDNGGPTPDNASDNAPLRGKKGDFFDGGIRVPFAVQWPGTIPAGSRYSNPVSSLDIFATAAAVSSVKPKNKLDGVNLIPYLTGKNKGIPHDYLFWRNIDGQKLAVRTPTSKLISQPNLEFLFNIKDDISEKNNLAKQDPKTLEALKTEANNWNQQLPPPAFLGLMQEKEYNQLHPDRFKVVDGF
ncbi:sulfatase-like hydrolase/transferase [Rudanella lutea]|uniref:sulfatase-like hydrolase/transferase n=1 Tax=Rudanella lutea TaxID=451374 RepID=UPI0003674C02|nr:sulfatase-like hydrolase/transferase [Rudanella lutea]